MLREQDLDGIAEVANREWMALRAKGIKRGANDFARAVCLLLNHVYPGTEWFVRVDDETKAVWIEWAVATS